MFKNILVTLLSTLTIIPAVIVIIVIALLTIALQVLALPMSLAVVPIGLKRMGGEGKDEGGSPTSLKK